MIGAIGVLLAIGAAALTVARMIAPSCGTPAPQLAAFAPWAILVWAPACVLLLVAGRWWEAAIAAAAVVLHLSWLLPPSRARAARVPATRDRPGAALRVMTLNVLFGQADPEQTLYLVRAERIDVLVLAEMTPEFVEALRACGIEDHFAHADLHPRPAGAGTGIWSRWPVRHLGLLQEEGQTMPQAVVAVPGCPAIAVIGVHTRAPAPDRLEAWRSDLALLAHRVSSDPAGPQIFAGDFNASRDHAGFRAILAAGLIDAADAVAGPPWTGFTWPANRAVPATRIDHVLVSPDSIAVTAVRLVKVNGTDHLGVVAELTLPRRD